MDRWGFLILMLAIAVLILGAMWIGWRRQRGRSKNLASSDELVGSEVARISRALYVSTTPIGMPFERVAIPGLEYRGRADIIFKADGIEIDLDGERPFAIRSEAVLGASTGGARVGKAVGTDGLSLLQWQHAGQTLESSFRLESAGEQTHFARAVNEMTSATPNSHAEHTP